MNTRHLTIADLRGRRWRGYVRESTQAQAERWSPERQRADLLRAAEELGLLAARPTWYERTGTGETQSDELNRALIDALNDEYDVLLVLTTSRFARNRAEAVRMKGLFAKAGVPIYFVADRILSGARSSALLEGVREVLDEHANEERRWFIAGGIRERQLAGRWQGAIPFGYRRRMVDRPDGSRGPDGGLELDPEDAGVVRSMFERAARGEAIEGWTRKRSRRMLMNPAYKGVLVRYNVERSGHYYREDDPHDGRTEVAGDWPAIVEPELWAQAQAAT